MKIAVGVSLVCCFVAEVFEHCSRGTLGGGGCYFVPPMMNCVTLYLSAGRQSSGFVVWHDGCSVTAVSRKVCRVAVILALSQGLRKSVPILL